MIHRRLSVPAVALCGAVLLSYTPGGAGAALRSPAYAPAGAGAAQAATPSRHIRYSEWSTTAELRRGKRAGTVVRQGAVRIGKPVGRITYDDPYGATTRRYAFGRWTSRWAAPRFGLTQLISSWNAQTPPGTWVRVEVRGRTGDGRTGSWDTLGRWAAHDRKFHRMSLGRQPDDVARVEVDTLVTRSGVRLASWQLRVTLLRRANSSRTPVLTSVGAVASALPGTPTVGRSRPGVAAGTRLTVPRYSQMIHRGEYPRWDNGGEAWCSPTSTSMVLGYWRRGPKPRQYAWVRDSYRQPWVDYAARYSYDYRYAGAGNWPFNTAYAARFGLQAFVTRLRSLREAERFIQAGIPLVVSISFGPGQLDGAPISSTSGHVLVISGFTPAGNVAVNDPAAATAKGVRRVYDRGQFENAWIPKTGGVAYVIRPPGRALPPSHGNW